MNIANRVFRSQHWFDPARADAMRGAATAARLALGRMRALAVEAQPSDPCVTTASMLFAVCDMTRARMFPTTRVLRLLEQELEGRWARLGSERARYIAGRACDLLEPPAFGPTLLSDHARHVLSIARMLGGEDDRARPLLLEDIVLGLLLCSPEGDASVAAHVVLRRLDLAPLSLLTRWVELARS